MFKKLVAWLNSDDGVYTRPMGFNSSIRSGNGRIQLDESNGKIWSEADDDFIDLEAAKSKLVDNQ